MCIEDMIINVVEEGERINIGRKRITGIMFTNDMVMLDERTGNLQKILTILKEGITEYGMKINVEKLK